MRPLVGRQMRDVGAEQFDLSRIRSQVAADLIEQRGLARAIRADDQTAFSRPDREGYALRDHEPAERLLQIDDFECMVRCQRDHRDSLRNCAVSLLKPGTSPAGITSTMNRNTSPSSMFHRSI